MREIKEIICDYIDDDNYQHIDCYFTNDESESGHTVAIVCLDTKKVFFTDNLYRSDEKVKEVIDNIVANI